VVTSEGKKKPGKPKIEAEKLRHCPNRKRQTRGGDARPQKTKVGENKGKEKTTGGGKEVCVNAEKR